MIKIKPIIYGNFVTVNSYISGEWINGVFTEGGLSVVGKSVIMPWNTNKDRNIMEAGGYTSDDRKAYAYDVLHSSDNTEKEVEINGEWFKLKYITTYNESTGNFYGLKRFNKVVV